MNKRISSFNVSQFVGGGSYSKYDVVSVQSGGFLPIYFVSYVDENTGNPSTGSFTSNEFWKCFSDTGFVASDVWVPSWQSNIEFQPRKKRISFDDGYSQRYSSDINAQQTMFQLVFTNITDKEAKSLLCFLEYKQGVDSFFYSLPVLNVQTGLFICEEWNVDFAQFNLNNISCKLEKVYDIDA